MLREKTLKYLAVGVSIPLVLLLTHLLQKGFSDFSKMEQASTGVIQKKTMTESMEDPMRMLVHGKLAEVQTCYNNQLKLGLRATGNLVIKWAVDSKGQASEFEEELNELGSAELYDCTTTAIQSWQFPKQRPTYIRYTFKMKMFESETERREISSVE